MGLIEITSPGIAYICLGGFSVAFSLFSLLAREKIYVNEVVLGTLFGIFMGPYFADVFDPRSWAEKSDAITLEVMRVVLATGLFAIGVELPKSYMAQHAKSLLAMVIPTMTIGWIIVAGLLRLLFPELHFISCLAISACLTPTDPIICAAVIGGKFARRHVPLDLRRLLAAESAANDGLAYPFLTLTLYLTLDQSSEVAISHWFLIGWLYQVFFGVVMGAVLGLIFSHFIKFSHKRGFMDRESYVAQYIALAIFITGIVSTLGSDDLLAAFAAGTAVSWDGDFNDHTEDEVFTSVIDLLLNCACFVYIGAWLPFKSFTIPDLNIDPWRLAMLTGGILFLRRIPAILALYRWIPEIASWREALFSGHFGPMGVGAIFISTLAVHRLPLPSDPPQTQQDILALAIHPIVSFVVLSSVIIHGLSIPFFNLGRNVSRTVSLSTTLTSRSRSYPDWILNVNRITITSQEPTSGVLNVAVHEAASPVTGNPSVPDQERVHTGQNVVVQEAAGPVTSAKGTPTSILQREHVHIIKNVAFHEAASPVASGKDTFISVPQPGHMHNEQNNVVQEAASPVTSAKGSIMQQDHVYIELPPDILAPSQASGYQ